MNVGAKHQIIVRLLKQNIYVMNVGIKYLGINDDYMAYKHSDSAKEMV